MLNTLNSPSETTVLFWNVEGHDLAKKFQDPSGKPGLFKADRNAFRERLRNALVELVTDYRVDILLIAEGKNVFENDGEIGGDANPLLTALNSKATSTKIRFRFAEQSRNEKVKVFYRLTGKKGVQPVRWMEPAGLRQFRTEQQAASGAKALPRRKTQRSFALPGTNGLQSSDPALRYTLWRILTHQTNEVLLVTVHLPSIQNEQGDGQRALCAALRRDITAAEAKLNHHQTVIVGDFNATPFDTGLTAAYGLHATPNAETALHAGKIWDRRRRLDGESYEYFFNPMWRFLGDEVPNRAPGTLYFESSRSVCYDWFLYDQVLVRPQLLDPGLFGLGPASQAPFSADQVEILKSSTTYQFHHDARELPDATDWSDHFPLLFRLNL